MHRRTFAGALLATSASMILSRARACDIPAPTEPAASPVPDVPLDSAERFFTWPTDDGPRSVWMQVEQFASSDVATVAQDAVMNEFVPEPLPKGEFYGSGLQIIEVRDMPADVDARMHAWSTIVGVAAYTTGYAAFTVREGPILWSGIVVTSRPDTAVGLASELIDRTREDQPPCSSLEWGLPTEDDLPNGARQEEIPYDGTPAGR
jgi:hypothetical protein